MAVKWRHIYWILQSAMQRLFHILLNNNKKLNILAEEEKSCKFKVKQLYIPCVGVKYCIAARVVSLGEALS